MVVFYVNFYPELGQNIENTINMIKNMNKPFLQLLEEDGKYMCFIMPTTREGSRIEKIDFEEPYPRCRSRNDFVYKGQGETTKKKKNIFQPQEEDKKEYCPKNKGFLTFYINFHPDVAIGIDEMINLIKKINAETLDKIKNDGRYQVMLLPTTKEACRIEKIDYEAPFPRWIAISAGKTNLPRPIVIEEEDPEELLIEEEG